jgi:mutator protein MutT
MPPAASVALALVVEDDRCLVQLRHSCDILNGLWEFPGGKLRPGESAEQAAVRECAEEVGLAVTPIARLPDHEASYAHARVTLHPVLCRAAGPLPANHWVELSRLRELPMPPINATIIDDLLKLLRTLQ